MKITTRTVAFTAAALVTVGTLTACSTGADTATPTTPTTVTATPATPLAQSSAPEPTPPKVTYKEASERTLAKVVRDPDSHAGEGYIIYGEVFQFDSATGLNMLLANVANRNTTSYGYFDGEVAKLTGDEGDLEDLIEGDVFRAKVIVTQSYTYDRATGGTNTVPAFEVTSIKRVGHND